MPRVLCLVPQNTQRTLPRAEQPHRSASLGLPETDKDQKQTVTSTVEYVTHQPNSQNTPTGQVLLPQATDERPEAQGEEENDPKVTRLEEGGQDGTQVVSTVGTVCPAAASHPLCTGPCLQRSLEQRR